jgi:hypothetical protein
VVLDISCDRTASDPAGRYTLQFNGYLPPAVPVRSHHLQNVPREEASYRRVVLSWAFIAHVIPVESKGMVIAWGGHRI